MGYRSDIRIITSEKGFEELKKFVTKYLKEHNEDYNLLENCDIKQEGKKQCYFGWNYVKWYENDYEDVDAIMEGLQHLSDKEYSYRYMRIGEEYDDVEEQYVFYFPITYMPNMIEIKVKRYQRKYLLKLKNKLIIQ